MVRFALRVAGAALLCSFTLLAVAAEPSVVGTWKLVSYSREDPATGAATQPWGEKPAGYLMLLLDGHMSAVITSDGRQPAVRGEEGFSDKQAKLFQTVTAYAGTYTAKGDSLSVHVEVAWLPEWVGSDQPRVFRIEGDRLTIRTQPIRSVSDGKLYVYVLVWKRVS